MDVLKKLRDSRVADSILAIAEKDMELAKRVALSIDDSAAKVLALLQLYSISKDEELLKHAVKYAKDDEDYLRIVEYAEPEVAKEVAELIVDKYKKNLALACIMEKSGDLNYALKMDDIKILSAAMKRLALKKPYPANLTIARMIPDPYYRCLALIEISKREKLDLRNEIAKNCGLIDNRALRNWIVKKIGHNDYISQD